MATKHLAKASMLIRAGNDSIFDAFVNRKSIAKFWLKKSSGDLETGATVTWEFKVPGAIEQTRIDRLIDGQLINFTWSDGVAVEIQIEPLKRGICVVRVAAGPFPSTTKAVDAAEGFSIVLCDLQKRCQRHFPKTVSETLSVNDPRLL